MTLETYRALRPSDYEDYMKYIFMEVAPEEVGNKDTFDDNFDNWLQAQDLDTIMRHADAYAGLLVSHNVQK